MDGDREEINMHSADLRRNAMTKQIFQLKSSTVYTSLNWSLASSILGLGHRASVQYLVILWKSVNPKSLARKTSAREGFARLPKGKVRPAILFLTRTERPYSAVPPRRRSIRAPRRRMR